MLDVVEGVFRNEKLAAGVEIENVVKVLDSGLLKRLELLDRKSVV